MCSKLAFGITDSTRLTQYRNRPVSVTDLYELHLTQNRR